MAVTVTNAFLVFGLVFTGLLARTILSKLRNPLNAIPGPWYAKFTVLPLKVAVLTGRRIHYIHSLHAKYGPYVRIGPNEVAVNDLQGAAQVHSIKASWEKAPWYDEITVLPRPTLFAMPDAKSHGVRRRLFARGFSKTNIRQNWEAAIRVKIELAVTQMRNEAARLGTADLLKWWTLMASDISSQVFCGESFHTLEAGEINEFIRSLTTGFKGGALGTELPFVRAIGKRLPFQATKELFCNAQYLAEYAKIACGNMRASQGGTNIFAHLQAESEKGETLDDVDVETEAVAMFVAGTDTTAISLTYLVWAVLSRPQLRDQLEAEVAALPDNFQDVDVEKLPLLNNVIEETLRLYGAAPGMLPRVVPPGGVDIGGYYLPQGSIASTHAYSMHRNADIYPNPEEFNPSRWEQPSEEAKKAFSAFSSGPRSCLGIHIAYSELRLGAAEFFRRCPGSRIAPSTTPESMELENFFLITPKAHRCEVVIGG